MSQTLKQLEAEIDSARAAEAAAREFDRLTDEGTPEAMRDRYSVGREGQIERSRRRVTDARDEYRRALEARA